MAPSTPLARRRPGWLIAAVAAALLVMSGTTGASAALPSLVGAPGSVRAVAGNNTARVSWTAPASANPRTTYYRVEAAPGGQTTFVEGTETSATVRFLNNGRAYSFTVAADDGDGWGPASEPSRAVTPRDVCTLQGTPGDDVLIGTSGDDAICGLGGNDRMRGGGGGDTYVGGAGVDSVDFGDAPDRVFAFLPDVSHLVTPNGFGWADGDGSDVLRADIESLRGSAHADVLEGDDGVNRIVGRRGADLVRGWGGGDTIVGSAGRDELWGQSGADRLRGRGGSDLLLPRGEDDLVNGGRGSDTVTFTSAVTVDLAAGTASGESTDVLRRVENVIGSPAADTLRGSAAGNVLRGGGGDDTLSGSRAADSLFGQGGDDAMDGGPGAGDRCDGGAGADTSADCESVVDVP